MLIRSRGHSRHLRLLKVVVVVVVVDVVVEVLVDVEVVVVRNFVVLGVVDSGVTVVVMVDDEVAE